MNREFIKKLLGEAATDEAVDAIMAEHGKGLEREKAKSAKALEQAEADKAQLAELQEKVSSFDAVSGDRDAFKAELDAMKAKLADDAAAAKAKAELDGYHAELDKLVPEGREFMNDYAKRGIYADAVEAFKADPTKGLKACFEALVKDADGNEKAGVWQNPQAPAKIPPMGNTTIVTGNPFAKESYNLTQQMKLYKENPSLARSMASDAGVTLPE